MTAAALRRSFALAALVLIPAACGRGSPHAPAHVLRIADNVDPTSLNPLLAHDQDTIGYDLLVTQTLVGLDERNHLVPVLVERVPTAANGGISADGTRIVYRLRRDVRFADGTPLTSEDVAFTFRAILDPRNPVESQDAYRRVAALETPDAHTVVVRLHRRWNAAVAELFAQADFAFGILPAHAFTGTDVTRAAWNQRPFGTGPFRVVEWTRANRIVLDPNPYFRPAPKLHRIVFELIPSVESSLLALAAHDVDVTEVGAGQIPQLRKIPGTFTLVTPLNGEYQLLLQTGTPPASSLHLRRAIAAALDSAQIVRGRFGTMVPADSFLPPVFAWHDPDPASMRADPARAGRELAAAGWKKSDSLTLAYQPERGSWLETVLQAQFRAAGMDVVLKPYPSAMFNAPEGPLRTGRFTLAVAQWIGGADPEQSVTLACSQRGGNGNNNTGFCDPAFEALYEDQSTTPSLQRRREDFIGMQRIVRSAVPLVPLAFQANVDAVDDRVSGFARNMLLYPVAPERWDAR